MLNRRDPMTRWTLVLASALALGATACGGSEDTDAGADAGVDAGVDTGVEPVDSGPRPDAGFVDSGPRPDAGHYCTSNGEVDVNGTAVAVADVTAPPVSSTGGPAVLSCIDNPPSENPPFITELCFTECLNFMGATPSEADIQALQIDVFTQDDGGNPVDPSYDYTTRRDRQPAGNTGAGGRIIPNTSDCDSGYQIEVGYSNLGEVLASETRYIVRVRTATASSPWPTTYLYNFIRRNDQSPDGNCGNDEQRIPSRQFEFPVPSAALLGAVVTAAGGNVVGADDLQDGLGSGHAIIEARDCAGGGGLTMSGVSAGFSPAPAGAYYLKSDFTVDSAATETADVGLYVAVGFPGNTATSSMTVNVASAVGATSDGSCTEEFGGLEIPVFSDGVTFLRTNRETVVHGR